jgi:hypothetical protein
VTIPKGVKEIVDYVCDGCTGLTSVTFASGTTLIGYSAFINCSSLPSITIPESLTRIEFEAFDGCENLKSVYISSMVKWLNTAILCSPMINGADLYLNGQPVTELVIPAEIVCIPQKAFSGCSSIRKVTIPQWVPRIDGEAFRNCANLEIVIFESEPEGIRYDAFAGCGKLKQVHMTDISRWLGISFANEFSNPLANRADLYLNGELVTELVIPAGTERICAFSFAGCQSITKVTIPRGILIIEDYAFHSCKNLETVKFRGKPKSVSDIAFAGCDKLKNFRYPTEDRPLDEWYDPDQYKDVEEKPGMFSQGPARTMLISNWSNFFFKFLVASGCYLLATRRKRY